MESDNPNLTTGTISAGSSGFVNPVYAKRNMKIYAIPENELEMLASINIETTIYFSAFSFFISFALSLLLNGIYANDMQVNTLGRVLFYYGTPLIAVLALIFLILGFCARNKKNNFINTIKNESVQS